MIASTCVLLVFVLLALGACCDDAPPDEEY